MGQDGETSGAGAFDEIPSWYAEEAAAAAATPPTEHLARPARPQPQMASMQGGPNMTPIQGGASTGKGGGFAIGTVLKFGVAGLFLFGGWFGTRGTTSAEALEVGDCFIMTQATEIDRVDTPDCSEPHDAEVVGLVEVASTGDYPSELDSYWEQVYDACGAEMFANITNVDAMPDDTQFELFTPNEAGWNSGDRESICIVHSPSGLTGSVIATPS